MNILIVDDEPSVRVSMARMLSELGDEYRIREAEDGEEAWELIQNEQTDLMITDIRMPELDGLQLTELVNQHYSDTEIVLLTGYAEFEYAVEALRKGVSEYLLKPVSKDTIADLVRKIHRKREKHTSIKASRQEKEGYGLHSGSTHYLIRSALQKMREQYHTPLTLTKLAEKLYVNPNYLSTIFKKETGLTFTQQLVRIRMEAAKKLLRESNLKIYEICKKIGYVDQAHFSRTFKSLEGMSPYEYRNARFPR